MQSFVFTVIDPIGFHARPASILTGTIGKFTSSAKLICRGREANPASILSVMALGIKYNDVVELIIEGPDEVEAMAALQEMLKSNKMY